MSFALIPSSEFRENWVPHFAKLLEFKTRKYKEDNPSYTFNYAGQRKAWISPGFHENNDALTFYICTGDRDFDKIFHENPRYFEIDGGRFNYKVTVMIKDGSYFGNLFASSPVDHRTLDEFEMLINGFTLSQALAGAFFGPEKNLSEIAFEKVVDSYDPKYAGEAFILGDQRQTYAAVYIAGSPRNTALELFVFPTEEDLQKAVTLRDYNPSFGKIDDFFHNQRLNEWDGLLIDFYRVDGRTFCAFSPLGRYRTLKEDKVNPFFETAFNDVWLLFKEVL